MRRLYAWMAGLVGIAALARLLARRRRPHATPAPAAETQPPTADPADELRRRLSETRTTPAAPTEASDDESVTVPTETLEERRSRVHAKAQEAIQAMQEPPS